MAGVFHRDDSECQGQNCQAPCNGETLADYVISETRRFCPNCAKRMSAEGSVVRVGDRQVSRFCAKHHDRPAKLFCHSERVLVCESCKLAYHGKCEFRDIEDAIKERTDNVSELYKLGLEKLEGLRRLDAEMTRKGVGIERHCQEQERAILDWSKDGLQEIKDRRNALAAKARDERDMKVKKAELELESRLRQIAADEEEEVESKQEWTRGILAQLKQATDKANSFIEEVKGNFQRCFHAVQELTDMAKQVLRDESAILNAGTAVLEKSLHDSLQTSVDTHLVDLAVGIIKGVKFVRYGANDIGRVWYSTHIVDVAADIRYPRVRFITENQVAVLDVKSKTLYSVNLDQRLTTKVAVKGIVNLATLPQEKIACMDNDGRIKIFSKQWKLLRIVSLLRNGIRDGLSYAQELEVDCRGNLLVKLSSKKISVIDPDAGVVKDSIRISSEDITDLVVMSSGDMITRSHTNGFQTYRKDGRRSNELRREKWKCAHITLDRQTDTPYFVYLDKEQQTIGMCRASVSGVVEEEEILNCHQLLNPRLPTHFDIFESEKLCVFNGTKLVVFRLAQL